MTSIVMCTMPSTYDHILGGLLLYEVFICAFSKWHLYAIETSTVITVFSSDRTDKSEYIPIDLYEALSLYNNIITAAWWINGQRVSLSCGRPWVRTETGSYQRVDLHKSSTNCLPAYDALIWVGFGSAPHRVKGWVEWGTVHWDMHYKDLLD